MKKSKKMIAPGIVLMLSLFLFSACSKEDTDNPVSWEDFKFSGVFTGNYTTSASSELEGYLTIENNGNLTMDVFNGKMTGTANEAGENYSISITQTSGIFQNISNVTGTLNSVDRTIALSGTDPSGSPITISGTVPEVPSNYSGNLAKSTVLFTHDQNGCVASITVDGTTLSGLQQFYETDNFCHPRYDLFRILVRNVDNKVSKIHCNSGTLTGLNGNPLPFTQCSVMSFVVNKNTQYFYTVNWNNGEVTTGQFTSPDGGKFITICPTSQNCGGAGGGTVPGTGQFSFNGLTYPSACASSPAPSCPGSGINVTLVSENGSNSFVIYNMPTTNSGTFTIADGELALNTCQLYGILNGSSQLYVTVNGSLTKTGATSFTFSGGIRNIISGTTTTLTGSGTY